MIRQVKARRLKVTDTEIGDALWKCRGIVKEAADRLGVTRVLVFDRIKKNPQLQYIRDSSRRMCMGYAEAGLDDALAEKKPWAILFVLQTLGRTDGLFDPEPWPVEPPVVEGVAPHGMGAAGERGTPIADGEGGASRPSAPGVPERAKLTGERGTPIADGEGGASRPSAPGVLERAKLTGECSGGQEAQGGTGGATGTAKAKRKKQAVAPVELDEDCGRRLDGGHRSFLDALEDGAPWAIKYCLKTFGKSKGYAPPKEHAGTPTFPKELMLDPILRTPETTTYYDVTEYNELWVAGDGRTIDDSTLGDLVMQIEYPYAVDRSAGEEATVDQPAASAVDPQTVEAHAAGASLGSELSQAMNGYKEVEGAQSQVVEGAQSLGRAKNGSAEVEIRVIKDVQPLTAQKTTSKGAQSLASRGAQSQRESNRNDRRGAMHQTAVVEDDQSVADNNPRGSDPTGPHRAPLRLEWAGNEVAKSLDPDVERSQIDAEPQRAEQQGDLAGGRSSC